MGFIIATAVHNTALTRVFLPTIRRCILIDTSNLKAGRVDEDGNALPDKATERDMAAFSALVPFLPMSGSEMYEVRPINLNPNPLPRTSSSSI